MEPLVIDDFLTKEHQDSLERMITGSDFPWNFHAYSVSEYPLTEHYYSDVEYKEHIQFRHVFFHENTIKSNFFQYIAPLLAEYQKKTNSNLNVYRIKANLLMPQKGPKSQQPHTDNMIFENGVFKGGNKRTLLYYVHNSDGDTVLYNKHYFGEPLGLVKEQKRVSPKKGRAIIFDSNQVHSGTCPTNSDYRVVINCVFEV
jgi:hypothetical protein